MSEPLPMKEMQERLRMLEHENMLLAERAEDSQILSFISQTIEQSENKHDMLAMTLEQMSMLKNIPFVACCQLKSGVAHVVESYMSFEHRDVNHQTFPCSQSIDVLSYWDEPAAALSSLSLGFMPTTALLIPFCSQYLGKGFYLFVTREEESNDFEYLSLTLERMTDLLSLSLENKSLLKSYQRLNEKLESKVQKRTQSLHDSQQKYQTLVDASDVAIMLFDMHHFVEANPAALLMFQCSKKQFLTLTPSKLSPQYQKNGALSHDCSVSYIQQTIDLGHAHFDWLHQRYHGDVFPCEVHLSRVVLKGKTLVQAVIVDLSERLAVQQKLADSEYRYRSIIENIQDFLYRTDVDGIFTFVAPSVESLLGISPSMLLGTAIQDIYVNSEQRRELLKQLHASKNGRIEDFRVELRHANGGSVSFSNHVHMIYDEHGVFSGVEGMARDLTDLKKMEEQFYQAQKMESLGTLVGGISHDFNNMLAAMTGTLYLMKPKLSKEQGLLKSVELMEKQAFRASDMIKQLLSFARKGEVNLQKVSLTDLFIEIKGLLVKSVPENITLHVGTIDKGLDVFGDASLLQQVWMNLVNNARDALTDTAHPEIHLSLKQCTMNSELLEQHPECEEGSLYAQLTVSDNGKGIAKEHQQHIFEPFFTTKKKHQGTGLGLAMIYGAVKSHQGWISVESQQGKGTAFHVYIPLQAIPEPARLSSLENSIEKGHGELILVVDDDDMIRDVSCELLKSLNYNVLQASDGVEALAIFKKHQKDIALLLTDVVMPNMGGWDLSTQIWLQKKHLPIVFISGYPDEEMSMLVEEREHVIVLRKPCSIEDLSQSIQTLLYSSPSCGN